MARHAELDPRAFELDGGPRGVLLIHGLTGSPAEMRPLGDYLAERGYAVAAPLLPGHGTTERALARVRWTDWTAAVARAYERLGAQSERVLVAGLSLGALLTLELAAGRPVAGVAVYSPPLAVGNPLIRLSWAYGWIPTAIPQSWTGTTEEDPEIDRRTWCYDRLPLPAIRQVHLLTERVRRLLPAVTAPVLVVMSRGDRSLRFEGAEVVLEEIGSQEKRLVTLTESGHNVLIDRDRELVWEETARFFGGVA